MFSVMARRIDSGSIYMYILLSSVGFLRKRERGPDGSERGPNGNGQVSVRDRVRRAGQLVALARLAGRQLFRSRRQLAERHLHHQQTGRLGILDRYRKHFSEPMTALTVGVGRGREYAWVSMGEKKANENRRHEECLAKNAPTLQV